MPRGTSTRNRAQRARERVVGRPYPGSCESRFPLLRNARVAGVQFLISVMVRGAGGYGVKRPSRTTALLPVPVGAWADIAPAKTLGIWVRKLSAKNDGL